jgi:hypothetical protein
VRWHLSPNKTWTKTDCGYTCGDISIAIQSSSKKHSTELSTGWESLYYIDKSEIPVIETTLKENSNVTTVITWNAPPE